MKILEIQGLVEGGGSEVHTHLLSRGLRERGHEVVVYVPESGDPLLAEMASSGLELVRFRQVPSWRRLADPAAIGRLLRLVRDRRFDVIHTHVWHADAWGLLVGRLTHTPVVATLHGYVRTEAFEKNLFTRALHAIHRGVLKRSDRLIAISDFVKRWNVAELGLDEDRIDVVLNCSDVEHYQRPVDRKEVRAALGIPPQAPLALTVGALKPQKGILDVIEAATRVRRQLPDAHFLLVGDGPLREEAGARAEALGVADAVHLLGHRRDVPQLMAASDLLLSTARGEGFGRTLTEAMSSARPVVAYHSGAAPEIVREGETGFLVPEGDLESLSSRIVRVLADTRLRGELGEAGLRRAREHFDIPAFVSGTDAVLEAVVGHRRRAASGSRRP